MRPWLLGWSGGGLGADHIAMIMELLGKIPPMIALSGSNSSRIFDPTGVAAVLCIPKGLLLKRTLSVCVSTCVHVTWRVVRPDARQAAAAH